MKRVGRLALAASIALFTGRAAAWQVIIDGVAGDDAATSVAVDAAGDVAAAGFMAGPGTGADFAVVKLRGADGAAAWPAVRIDGTAHQDDRANAVAVDASGNVFAAGSLRGTSGDDFVVLALDAADGHERWRWVLQGTFAGGDDQAVAIAVDRNGDVFAAGYTLNAGTSLDLAVVKLGGASGMPLWPAPVQLDGAAHSGDGATSLALDAQGNAVVGGFTSNGQGLDFTVLKLAAADGTILWRRDVDGTSHAADAADAVAVDADGNVAASGFTTNAGNTDFTVVRLAAADGTPLWPAPVTIDGSAAESDDEARAVGLDAAGNVFAAGVIDDTGTDADVGYDFTVLALRAADGGELWRRRVKGTGPTSVVDDGFALAVDAAGNPAAAGRVENTGVSRDLTVVRLSRTDGAEIWRHTSNGSADGRDEARAVAIDVAGNVAAAGRVENTGAGQDFTVLKLGCAGGEPVACPDPATCYDVRACDPSSVDCTTSPDGTRCDDGNACTENDACRAGSCVADDLSAVRCALAAALSDPACGADRLPRGVKRGFKKARTLVERGVARPARAKRLYGKARKKLDPIPGALDKATARARRPVSAPCAAALRAVVEDVRPRLDRLAL
ncbi:MAG TPA: SBBP repeat-containing protein [Candidatus Binatia bacterium]|nr:SBBP repeat-containing protein [Candidatus Binatia bacterium]